MSALEGKLIRLLKAANVYPGTTYNHFLTLEVNRRGGADVPLYLQRAMMQTSFAFRMSEARGGAFDDTVSAAVDCLLAAYENEGAVSRAKAMEAETILLPLSNEAKKYTGHMVAHAHIDMNWQWPYHETVAVTLETFRTVLQLMKEYPDFTYAQSQASTYRIVEEYEPEMLDEIRARVKDGRWEVSASTWVEADKNMPSAESMARHLLYTKEYLSKLLDIAPETLNLDYEPDTFGHSANVPEILAGGGVKYYYYCRGRGGAGAHIWRAQSGAEVLAYQEPTWYLGDVNPNFAMYAPDFCRKTGVMDFIKVYGVGDHGGGPTRQDLSYIEEMRTWPVFPRLIYSSYRAFFAALEAVRDRLPVVTGEFNCVFTGCYTTQCRVKASNRLGEATLGEAEALSALAKSLCGKPYRQKTFEEGWRNVLFSQFHDILTGSGVRDTREYALATFSQTMAAAGTEYAAAMRAIAQNIDTSMVTEKGADALTRAEGAGVGFDSMRFRPPVAERCAALTRVFHVFNPAPAPRKGMAELVVWDYPGELAQLCARDLAGSALAMQILSNGTQGYMGHSYVRALVDVEAPAFGWTTVVLDEAEEAHFPLNLPGDPRVHKPEAFVLENETLRAEFDTINGMLKSLICKETGKEMLSGPAGFFDILEDAQRGMTSWVVGRYTRREPIARDVRVSHGACGALQNGITVKAAFGTASKLEYTVTLDRGARALRYQVKCDWRERGTRENGMVQLAFAAPFGYDARIARYDVPAGTIDRAPMEMDAPANSYVCALNETGAPSLLLTSDAKYGMRYFDSTLQMTLIRAGFDPDPDPENGKHEFGISLGIVSDTSGAALARECAFINRPMSFITARPHKGTLPGEGSFLSVAGENAYASALKLSEDGQSLILRVTNYAGAQTARVACRLTIKAAYLSDALEARGEALRTEKGECLLPLRAHALVTVRIDL